MKKSHNITYIAIVYHNYNLQWKGFIYTISMCYNTLDFALSIDVMSGSLNLVSDKLSSSFSCYSYNIPYIPDQNCVNHTYMIRSNIVACVLIAKKCVLNYTVTTLQGGHIWAFLHQVLCIYWLLRLAWQDIKKKSLQFS